jgi:hypothetical protein
MLDPIAQPLAYHNFADQRLLLHTSNALNVWSNLPFLLVGFYGLVWVKRLAGTQRLAQPWEIWGLGVLFTGIALVSVGSAYYHLAPDNERLVWDRLPMTVAFTALFALQIGERLSQRAGKVLLFPMVLVGLWSVLEWHWSEQAGHGDLRFYAMVQFFPLVTILLLLWLRPPTYTRGRDLVWALSWYVLAKILEMSDGWVYRWGEWASGHTLKHLAAGVAVWIIARMVVQRELAAEPPHHQELQAADEAAQ